MYIMGIDVTAADATAEFSVGSLGAIIDNQDDRLPKVFVYVQASAAVSAGQAVLVNYDHTAIPTPTGALANAAGRRVAVAPHDIGSGEFGWVQVYGNCEVNVIASTAVGAAVSTGATAGSLDDLTAGANLRPVTGVLIGAVDGTTGTAFLNWPTAGAAFS